MSLRRRLFDMGSEGVIRDLGLLVLRLGFSLPMLFGHGLGKMERLLSGSTRFADPLGIGSGLSLGLAAASEFVFAFLLAVGLMSRVSTIPLVVTMGVAFFLHHGSDPFGEKEKALLYLVGFVALFLTGPGRFSIDRLLQKRKRAG